MFGSIKNLIGEMVQTVKKTDFKRLYSRAVNGTRDNISELKYKISHLFDTNLQNGLNHYYSGHYKDALIRFKLMNNMWKNNALVNYNLGRAYFELEKYDKAENTLRKALTLNPQENLITLTNYYLTKILNVENVAFVPKEIKSEFYDYSINSFSSEYAIHEPQLRQIFDIYDRYIGSFVVDKGEENVFMLDIGCHVGLFGKFCRKTYRKVHIDGIDFSQEMVKHCQNLTIRNSEKVYNSVIQAEMHEFLNQNSQHLHKKDSSNKESKIENSQENTDINTDIIQSDKEIEIDIESINNSVENQEYSEESRTNYLSESQGEEPNNSQSEKQDNPQSENPDVPQDTDNENMEKSEHDYDDYKFYDIMTAIGTFADFGDISVILHLCEINLNLGGILVFVLSKSDTENIQFSKYRDSFYYTEEYINTTIKNETKFKILEMTVLSVIDPENKQIVVVLKKI